MELYFKNIRDITYPERSDSFKNSIGIPKNNQKIFYIRDKSGLTLDIEDVKGLIRPYNLRSLEFRKL